ncbi:MAG TPA: acyl-CoA thioesterase [Caldithrix abyssi]|uniref:Acyl-CoA thioesterase n=1 Tax=Caldithrix abyssi TaxID=187145 RepID=A0A7V1PWA3_CALAY|nr:acyl-CoA thioesterase [Caldithrix abyssi]
MKAKKSEPISSWDIVFPNDANPMGTMFGGRLMAIMDEMSGIAASRYCGRPSVTASTEAFIFYNPVRVGDRIETIARVVWVGTTSMVVKVQVFSENPIKGIERRQCTTAHFNMVAVDEQGRPTSVPPLLIETTREQQDYDVAEIVKNQALIRKQEVKKRKEV